MSTAYIWLYKVYPTIIYGGQIIQEVHNFHVVLPVLHPVAPGCIGMHLTWRREGDSIL